MIVLHQHRANFRTNSGILNIMSILAIGNNSNQGKLVRRNKFQIYSLTRGLTDKRLDTVSKVEPMTAEFKRCLTQQLFTRST